MQSTTRHSALSIGAVTMGWTRVVTIAAEWAADLITLIGAYLVALYLQEILPSTGEAGVGYVWSDFRPFVVLSVATVTVVHAASALLIALKRDVRHVRLWTRLAALGITFADLGLLEPEPPVRQSVCYLICGLLFILLLTSPAAERGGEAGMTSRANLVRLWSNRSLLRIWVHYNIKSRYAQAFLGIVWIVLLPLTTAFVMSIVFSDIMRVHLPNIPFIVFFLAGFVPWGLFNQSIGAGMRSILSALGLINQIYFPREIIVLSALGEALVDTAFMFASMLVINAIAGVPPNSTYIFLIPLFLIEIALTLGLMFILSWLSVLIRDIPQLVSVLLQVLFYLSAVIYPVAIVPSQYRFLIALNPIGVIVETAQRIVVYNRSPDWLSLTYPAALGITLLIFGYRLFKRNEDRMADMI